MNRAFVLSTPRLPEAERLQVNLPFCDRAWDRLFAIAPHSPICPADGPPPSHLDGPQTEGFADLFHPHLSAPAPTALHWRRRSAFATLAMPAS